MDRQVGLYLFKTRSVNALVATSLNILMPLKSLMQLRYLPDVCCLFQSPEAAIKVAVESI